MSTCMWVFFCNGSMHTITFMNLWFRIENAISWSIRSLDSIITFSRSAEQSRLWLAMTLKKCMIYIFVRLNQSWTDTLRLPRFPNQLPLCSIRSWAQPVDPPKVTSIRNVCHSSILESTETFAIERPM